MRRLDKHEPIAVGDMVVWGEMWGHPLASATITEAHDGMTTTHFRVKFDDPSAEEINLEEPEWWNLKHLRGAVVFRSDDEVSG